MNQIKNIKQENNFPVYITLSLPSGLAGRRLKEAIKDVAKSNQRSVSNQCVCILQEALESMGKLPPSEPEENKPWETRMQS